MAATGQTLSNPPMLSGDIKYDEGGNRFVLDSSGAWIPHPDSSYRALQLDEYHAASATQGPNEPIECAFEVGFHAIKSSGV